MLKILNQEDFESTIIKDLGIIGKGKKGIRYAVFKCAGCKVEDIRNVSSAKRARGNTCKHCSNLNKNITHGKSYHPLYIVWNDIKDRCYNKNNKKYRIYGEIGTTMCDSWKNDFKLFYDWAIENGWKKGLQIDKDTIVKGNKVYSPETCTLLTNRENSIPTASGVNKIKGLPRGVYFVKKSTNRPYMAQIKVLGKTNYLGSYSDIQGACDAYNTFCDNTLEANNYPRSVQSKH